MNYVELSGPKSGAIKEAKAEKKARSSTSNPYAEQQRKRQVEQRRRSAISKLAFAKLNDAQHADCAGEKWWRFLAGALVRMIDSEDMRAFLKRRDIDAPMGYGNKCEAKVRELVRTARPAELPGLAVELVASYHAIGGIYAGGLGENLKSACELFKVDLAKLKTEVAAAEKAKAKSKPASKRKAGAK